MKQMIRYEIVIHLLGFYNLVKAFFRVSEETSWLRP